MTNVVDLRKAVAAGFNYVPGDDVMVTAIGTKGKVVQVIIGIKAIPEYQVVFWINDHRRVEWLMDYEIEKAK